MSLTDILMVAATALSPLIAVQVTKYLDGRNEARVRKLLVFKALMATRAYTLSIRHVEALNSIDLEFSAKSRPEKRVLGCWELYLDHMNQSRWESQQAWEDKRVDLLCDLLFAMAQSLGYDFSKSQIKNMAYAPTGHRMVDSEQQALRQLGVEVLQGKRAVKVVVAESSERSSDKAQ